MKNFLIILAIIVCIAIFLVITFRPVQSERKIPSAETKDTTFFNLPEAFTVGFYNVENLFDIYDDPTRNDNEFLPRGDKNWTEERYKNKLSMLSKVVNELGDADGPELLGLCEVENRRVLEDLVVQPEIKSRNYKIIHYDSPDPRGIDVALLYKYGSFNPFLSRPCHVKDYIKTRMRTRDILLVGGTVGHDTVFIFVNHWPSRMKGKEASEIKRVQVAGIVKNIIDSLKIHHPKADYVLMGDLNDEPMDKSIFEVLQCKDSSVLYNSFAKIQADGAGTYKYGAKWNLLDHIIISPSSDGLIFKTSGIYNPSYLYKKNDPKKGPFKTFSGKKYFGGYSDHLPVYVTFSLN